jgi:hypothetical protein
MPTPLVKPNCYFRICVAEYFFKEGTINPYRNLITRLAMIIGRYSLTSWVRGYNLFRQIRRHLKWYSANSYWLSYRLSYLHYGLLFIRGFLAYIFTTTFSSKIEYHVTNAVTAPSFTFIYIFCRILCIYLDKSPLREGVNLGHS